MNVMYVVTTMSQVYSKKCFLFYLYVFVKMVCFFMYIFRSRIIHIVCEGAVLKNDIHKVPNIPLVGVSVVC